MTDLDRLRRHDRTLPPAGALEQVVRRGRSRRRAAIGLSTSCVVASAVAVAMLSGPGSGNAGLELTDQPASTPSTASSEPASATGLELGGDVDQPGDVAAAGATAAGPAETRASARPTASARPASGAGALASDMRREVVPFAAGECQGATAGGETTGWCTRYVGPDSSRAGQPVALAYEVCRIAPTPGEVTFSSTKELDVYVRQAQVDERTWQWSVGRRFAPRRSEATVQPRTCLRWTTTWRTLDQRGRHPAPGDYLLNYDVEFSFGAKTPDVYANVSPDRPFRITA